MIKRLVFVWPFIVLLLAGQGLAQVDRSAEVSKLMAGLNSASRFQRVNAAKIISRSGLQDKALYQRVADLLTAGYTQEYEEEQTDEMSWLCKALAASGDDQYRVLLNEVATNAPSVKLKSYARESVAMIAQYAQQSRVMNATDAWDAELSAEENRLLNMLRSQIPELRRDAAKVIVRHADKHAKVFAAVAVALEGMSKEAHSDSLYVDTMSWLCKALAVSGDSQYITLLNQIHDNTESVKLRSYAKKAIGNLQ